MYNSHQDFLSQMAYWLSRRALQLLQWSIGIVFFWFGALKFFPGLSPEEAIGAKTIVTLTFHIFTERHAAIILAVLETVIGLGLLTGFFPRFVLLLLFFQMLGTFTPLFLFPNETFQHVPYAPTLQGQFIIKNLILLSAAAALAGASKGDSLKPPKNP